MSTAPYPPTLSLVTPPITPVQLALFAAASGDHNPLHLDPEAAQRAGFQRPLVHGMLSMALAGRLFTHRFGRSALRMLHTRFTGVAFVGEALELGATLERVEDGQAHYALRASTITGREVLSGTARVQA